MSHAQFGRPVSVPTGEFMFGRYHVRRLLGAGGMASVFLAEDTLGRRPVALKVMSQELEADPEYRARFVREARVLLGLRHPNVVQVVDAGEEGGRPYFVMEYLEGEDLEQRIRRTGQLHWRDALALMRQALLGLAAAWQAGVVHRDVKPENLFITQGVLKVMDFGVARPLQADGFQTQMGMVVGTPAYIAPEQAMGRKVDFRADLYALGATFWHVMAGRTPYGEGSPTALCNCHVYEPFPSLAQVLPSAPRGVVDLMARLAEKDPGNRGDQQGTLMALDALLAAPAESPRPAAAAAGPRLVVESGRMVGTVLSVPEGELIIGRMPGCGLVLDDARASRRHAVVARRGAFLEVRDLGSRNGVLLNGHPVQTAPLAEGDRVTVGDTVMRVEGLAGVYTDPVVTSGKGYSPADLGLPPRPAADPLAQAMGMAVGAPQQQAPPPPGPLPSPPMAGVVIARGQAGPPAPPPPGPAGQPVGQKEVLHSRAEQAGFEKLADGRMAATTPLSRHLQILYRLGKAVAGAMDMADLGNRVMELVSEAVPFDRGFVLVEGSTVGADGRRDWTAVSSRDAHGQAVNGRPSATVLKRVRDDGVSLQTADATTDQRLDMAASVMNLRIRGVLCAPMWAGDQMLGAVYLDRGTQRPFVAEELITLEAISDFAGTAFQQHLNAARARAASRMVEDLARFVAPEVKQELDRRSETDVAALLSHREMVCTVLFCDIKGFTPLCERLKPGEVATLLTQYFNALTDAVMAEKGSLNKFIGDACMGLFGVPLPLDNNSLRAVNAGAGIIQRIHALQQTLPPDRRFQVRVGINTGVAVAGAFGSERRMEYTVLGDVVNTAARLESNATPMGILVGEQTYQDVKDLVPCHPRGSITVKGKAQPVTVYEIHVPGITGVA
ncbi:MAG: protein kinase [Deltaproteobacteria bacterium]|nr:protein kinase [Deltaproteobacteria bacterium]